MNPTWHFLRQAAMMVPADQMANPLQHTRLSDAELLMREAIQNSADERRDDASGPVRFSVRRRQYRGEEKSALVSKFGLAEIAERAKSFPEAHGWFKYEETCLSCLNDLDVPISALLLTDHNTNGLGGNWRTSEGVNSRFYNLVLSIYTSNKLEDAGDLLGSYGVGKMVYAVTSKIRTMAYYSCFEPTDSTGGASARFMATAFLPGHRIENSDYTGHAFFGPASGNEDYPARPLIDDDAHELARSVGLEVRSPDDTGLTVMLLDCDMLPSDCLDACEKFWWPRTFNAHAKEYVDLEFFDEESKLLLPRPSDRPDIKPFVDCYANIKQGVEPEAYENKKINLAVSGEVGHLCLKALGGIKAEQNALANTVALIRSGLVIQYNSDYAREGDPDAVGVFEAIGKKPSKCFTLSEPEAHDEWNESNARLRRSLGESAADLVRLTHHRIKERFRDFQTRQKDAPSTTTSEGLDFLDDILGPIFRKRKKGPPSRPKPARRAFTVHKKGRRDFNCDPVIDHLDFTVALAEGVSVEPVLCKVKVILKVLEDAEAKPGTSISCTVFDADGASIPNRSDSFGVKLIPDRPLAFHASAHVHPSWRTRWAVTVVRDLTASSGGEDA